MTQPDSNGLYHPASEDDIVSLIQYAIQNKLQVRVSGAAQSMPGGVFTDGYSNAENTSPATKNINLMLDKMRAVTIDTVTKQATVQAGCNLGYDPYDPTGTSSPENGLFYQLQQKGLAIPNVSDEIHQTVGGYMSTGSSGGSVEHSFFEWILSIRLIDGKGDIKVFQKPDPDNPQDTFYAVGVSMGLLGVITEVTFQCITTFNIIGKQNIDPANSAPVDVFGRGNESTPNLQNYLTDTEFTRLLWWPFPTVNRLITWQARTMLSADYNNQTGTVNDFKPKPYQDVFFSVLGTQIPSEGMADAFFTLIGNWPQPLIDLLGNSETTTAIETFVGLAWPYMLPLLLNCYFPCDGDKPPQQFWDTWAHGLPMDTAEYNNRLFPALHTELWISLSQAQQVMSLLLDYYKNDYFKDSNDTNRNYTNGCYTIEILGAKHSPFWMSPGYDQDSLRINIFWFGNNAGNVLDFYQQFWDLFKKNNISYRLHWSYCLPPATGEEGASWLKTQYPGWDQFMSLRSEMDPENIFLNSYWKDQLGITV